MFKKKKMKKGKNRILTFNLFSVTRSRAEFIQNEDKRCKIDVVFNLFFFNLVMETHARKSATAQLGHKKEAGL